MEAIALPLGRFALRATALIFVLGLSLTTSPMARAEIEYPWCSQSAGSSENDGGRSCSYVSFEQCRASVQGSNALCVRNDNYRPPQTPERR